MYDLTTITTKVMTSRIFQHKQNLLTLHTQKGRGNIKLYLLTAWIIKYLLNILVDFQKITSCTMNTFVVSTYLDAT